MTLPRTIEDREYGKFEDTVDGPAVRTTASFSMGSSMSVTPKGATTATATFPKQVSVTSASTPLFATNTSAIYRHLYNASDTTIWIQYGAPAVVGEGIAIRPNSLKLITGFDLWKGSINAIVAAGTAAVNLMEAT